MLPEYHSENQMAEKKKKKKKKKKRGNTPVTRGWSRLRNRRLAIKSGKKREIFFFVKAEIFLLLTASVRSRSLDQPLVTGVFAMNLFVS